MTEKLKKNIMFSGNPNLRDDMLALVDEVLKSHGNVDGCSDLSAGLLVISENNKIKIIDEDDSLAVFIEAVNGKNDGEGFVIDKKTKTLYKSGSGKSDKVVVDQDMDFLDEI